MSTQPPNLTHYLETLRFGLVYIPAGTKGPNTSGWQDHPITTPEEAFRIWQRGGNVGLHHAVSRTAVLDIDHPEWAALALLMVDIDLEALLDAPGPKVRGAKGLKPVYRLPDGLELRRHALAWKEPGAAKAVTVFELRAGMVQDVLPPSIHPDTGKPYAWEPEMPKNRGDIPELPGNLRALWENWSVLKPELDKAQPWAAPPPPRTYEDARQGGSVIAAFNKVYEVGNVLTAHGYSLKGEDRWLSPHSSSGLAGVVSLKGDDGLVRVYCHHAADPLGDGHAHDAFSTWCLLEHGGDIKAAVKAAATELGLSAFPSSTAAGRPEAKDTEQPTAAPWPVLRPEALHGLAGEIVRLISPHTEADDAALLFQTLAAFGTAVGRRPYYLVESDRHHANSFIAIVGNTAKGRKGTSWGRVRRLMEIADLTLSERLESGLSSGEGLIWAVRDSSEDHDGAEDKRLLIVESELASPLKVMAREGNTLSAVVRNAWDTGALQSLTKNNPAKATNAHIGIIGHITKTELLRHLDATEFANGFANRFLYVCVRRSKVLPFGGNLDDEALAQLGRELGEVLKAAKPFERVTMSPISREVWRAIYSDLSDAKPGLFGSLIARSEAQVLRLALLYALLDTSHTIERSHLEAALACWDYCEASARYLFGASLGDPVADTILGALNNSKDGMTRTEISALFNRNAKSSQIDRALSSLEDANLAFSIPKPNPAGGRPSEVWRVRA